MQFRIVKTDESSYQLERRLPEQFFNGKEEWDLVKCGLSSPREAEALAYDIQYGLDSYKVGDVVKRFDI